MKITDIPCENYRMRIDVMPTDQVRQRQKTEIPSMGWAHYSGQQNLPRNTYTRPIDYGAILDPLVEELQEWFGDYNHELQPWQCEEDEEPSELDAQFGEAISAAINIVQIKLRPIRAEITPESSTSTAGRIKVQGGKHLFALPSAAAELVAAESALPTPAMFDTKLIMKYETDNIVVTIGQDRFILPWKGPCQGGTVVAGDYCQHGPIRQPWVRGYHPVSGHEALRRVVCERADPLVICERNKNVWTTICVAVLFDVLTLIIII
ncbi:uncharacterized protein VTP21DRAFT_5319 [Calcarisporiella thermophila]|uniref:uncharacterized protein n=1 Tax=Calcarisporiella thermophila TaxID=911321 RepID=UPI003743CE10